MNKANGLQRRVCMADVDVENLMGGDTERCDTS